MMRVIKSRPWLAAMAVSSVLLIATAVAAASTTPTPFPSTNKGAWTFKSAPNLHPPKVHTNKIGHGTLAPGYLLVANFKNILSPKPFAGQGGPLILDSHLQPVWFRPAPAGLYTNNLALQTYQGKPALSWWQGLIGPTGNTTQGTDFLVDQHYKTIATITAPAPWVITQHEMIVQGHNAWVTANAPAIVPAGKVPGCATCTKVVDSAVQEYDLTTGKLIYSWSALKHIPLSESQQPDSPSTPAWDAYHINSIQLISGGHGGRFITSMRNTWAGYLVDIATGKIDWTIGGKASTFKFANSNARFSWQHDIEVHAHNLLTVFDDHCCQLTGNPKSPFVTPDGQSRGLLLRLDKSKRTATYVHQYVLPGQANARYTAFQGNMQLLHNGNVVVGWGSSPYVSEFTYSGTLIRDWVFPTPDLTYRGYVGNWVGLPGTDQLRAVAIKSNGKTTVYASWDGATRVAGWRVLGGSSSKHLRIIATAPRSGFETAIKLRKGYAHYAIQALDANGRPLDKAKAFGTGSGSGGSGSGGSGGSGGGGTGPGGY